MRTLALTKAQGRPLYRQLYEMLRQRVRSGELRPGDMLPPESALTATYGVSRITVRAALALLVEDGVIDRHRGRGSFVTAGEPASATCLTSFTEQVTRSGRRPTTDLLGMRVAEARSFEPVPLPFPPATRVVRLERLRRVDDAPVALVRSYLPERVVRGIAPDAFATAGPGQSLLHVLQHRFGVEVVNGEETVRPAAVGASDAGLLGVAPGTPVAIWTCRAVNRSGRTCLYEEAVWCAPHTLLLRQAGDALTPSEMS